MMGEWIPVGEKLPPESVRVLVTVNGSVFAGVYSKSSNEWYYGMDRDMAVTHRMPLPNPPKDIDAPVLDAWEQMGMEEEKC